MGTLDGALGVLNLTIKDEEENKEYKLELKPTFKEKRKFRKLLLDDKNKKDKDYLYTNFSDFMVTFIGRDCPDESQESILEFVESYLNPLFEEIMIAFKWSTRKEMEQSKKEMLSDAKKLMSDG